MHLEDWNLYSLNYLHAGAPKAWVVIKPEHRTRLEEHARRYHGVVNEDFMANELCGQFLRHLALWIPLETLRKWNVSYTTLLQQPGDLIVTAPGACHQGFNIGYNVAEAINYGDANSPVRTRDYRPCGSKDICGDEPPVVLKWM